MAAAIDFGKWRIIQALPVNAWHLVQKEIINGLLEAQVKA